VRALSADWSAAEGAVVSVAMARTLAAAAPIKGVVVRARIGNLR